MTKEEFRERLQHILLRKYLTRDPEELALLTAEQQELRHEYKLSLVEQMRTEGKFKTK